MIFYYSIGNLQAGGRNLLYRDDIAHSKAATKTTIAAHIKSFPHNLRNT